jgi:hypothetical protein
MMCVARPCAIICIFASLALMSPPYATPHNAALDTWPRLMVWAWERPEDLRGLDRAIGAAFLARTITIAGAQFRLHPRRQSLRVSPDAALRGGHTDRGRGAGRALVRAGHDWRASKHRPLPPPRRCQVSSASRWILMPALRNARSTGS